MTKIGISKAVFLTELRDYVMIFIAMMSYCIGWNIFLIICNLLGYGNTCTVDILWHKCHTAPDSIEDTGVEILC